MSKKLTTIAFGALILPFVAGCATKGFVRTELATQRTQIDSSIAMERSERMMGDSAIRADMANLRRDLDSLRSEFNVKIQEVAGAIKVFTPVNFAFDDATVREEDKPMLDRFAQVIGRHYNGSKLTVEGFADPAGSQAYNRALSMRRAESVRQYLSEKGVTNQLEAVGYGEARQVVKGAQKDDPGALENRRVVFVIESPSQGTAATTQTQSN
ncbi:MAG TPA: OmpA family protein [Gemmatimonadaceae bacterium]|nr:OmpA family protein [Gemmatimonadaceae bacterium]